MEKKKNQNTNTKHLKIQTKTMKSALLHRTKVSGYQQVKSQKQPEGYNPHTHYIDLTHFPQYVSKAVFFCMVGRATIAEPFVQLSCSSLLYFSGYFQQQKYSVFVTPHRKQESVW